MKLRTPEVLASTARSRAGEDNEKFQNSIKALNPLLPSVTTFRSAGLPLHGQHSVVRARRCNRPLKLYITTFASRCFPRTIKIPARLRYRTLEVLPGSRRISTRLSHVLQKLGVRVLGDLHRRRVGDFAFQRNCGLITLQELDSLASAFTYQPSSRNPGTTASRGTTAKTRQKGTHYVIPKSARRLRFDELPITKHLANVTHSVGLRTLGNLHGRNPFQLRQWKSCGWRTLAEIQQLIERAISGEFDIARMDESTALVELLTLLDQGIAKLAFRDKQVLLARISGKTFAEIGRRYGFTRACAHKVTMKTLGILRKTYGPRIPELLEVVRRRCLSISDCSGLTPVLLEQRIAASTKSFRLSKKAQIRLIAALDKRIPCWVD